MSFYWWSPLLYVYYLLELSFQFLLSEYYLVNFIELLLSIYTAGKHMLVGWASAVPRNYICSDNCWV